MSYEILIGIFVFLFGIIFGSFYNVVIYRLPAEMPISKGRSMCFNCKHILGFFDLFPLFSYLFLGGKCRYCKAKISPRYFFVELLTGILFVLAYVKYSLSYEFIILCVFFSMLIIVGFIDYDTMYIYDCVLWIFSGITFILMIIYNAMNIIESSAYEHTFNTIFIYVITSMKYNILGLVVGAFIYFAIYYIAKMLYGKEAFGVGDIFLNAAIGFVMGTPYIVISSFFAFFVGLFFIVIFAILGKKFKLKQEVSFGPYMCVSAVIISLYGSEMINYYIDFLYNM